MRPLALLAVAALPGAGCLATDAPAAEGVDGATDCYQSFLASKWTQPGLFDAVPAEGSFGGYAVTTRSWGGGASLGEIADGRAVTKVDWWGPGEGVRREFFTLAENDRLGGHVAISALLQDVRDEDAVRALFHRFAANVTEADAATLQEWEDEFWRSGANKGGARGSDGVNVELHSYAVRVQGPFRAGALYNELAATGDVERRTPSHHVVGDWWFELHTPRRVAERAHGNETWTFEVHPTGNASFYRAAERPTTHDALARELDRLFRALDAPAPPDAAREFHAFCPD